jgi:hypothetical protein
VIEISSNIFEGSSATIDHIEVQGTVSGFSPYFTSITDNIFRDGGKVIEHNASGTNEYLNIMDNNIFDIATPTIPTSLVSPNYRVLSNRNY